MATLYFKVSSDYDEVIRLRQECEKLEAQLKKMDVNKAPAAARALETQLASTRQQMMGLVTEAAKAGAVMERDFKNGIYNASQTVNDLTQKIIDQKRVVKDVEYDVKRLGEAYKVSLKRNPLGASEQLAEYKAAKKALEEEKAALFALTQQQAEARLSVKKLKDEYSAFNQESGKTVQSSEGFSLSLKKVLGVIGGVTALKQLASEIIRVRGEFQSMDTAIETMVGKDMANRLIPQIKELAKISPLTVSDMVGAEKMMLGFNIQAEDTIRYLQALSDISMGDSVKFKSLILAFSQMSAAGKLMGQDLNQMINAGFNPLQIISEKTGKSIAALKEEMSKGAVSAEMVQQAFIDATSAGGKFYNMSSNASKTINGQISMMEDAWDAALNDMGKASEGIIMDGIQATTALIQNYEMVGKVLIGLVVTYGTYRTAVMLATLATSKHTVAEITLTNVRILARKAQLALNASMLTNPYVAVATVLTGLIVTMWTFHDSTTTTEAANKSLADTLEGVKQKQKEHKEVIEELINKATDEKNATNERNDALKSLVAAYPSIIKKYIDEEGHLTNIIALKKEIAELDSQKSVMTLGQKVSKNQEYVNFLRNVKSGKVNLHSDENLLNWYTSLEERALKSYSGRSALTIDEMLSFYEKKQKGLTDTYNRSKTEDKINKLTSSFKDSTDEKLNNLLNSRKQLLSQFTNKIGYVYDAAVKDYVKKTDVEAQISQIEGIQTSRKKGKDKAYWEKRNKEAKAKLEALDVSQKGSDLWNKYAKEIEDSQKKIDLYSISKSNSAELKEVKQENQVTSQSSKLTEIEKKQAIERAKEAVDLENQIEQARIDAMADGGDKILAQRELNNKKEMQAIDRAKEEYIQKEIQRQKEIFEATEDLKAKKNPKYKKRSFDSSSVSVDTSAFDILKENTDKRQVQEDLNAQREAMNAYLAEYGTYMQKRQAIIEQYQDKINKAATEGEKLTLGKQRDNILSGIDEQANRTTSAVSLLFGDMKDKTLKDLEAINIAGQKALEFLKSGQWDEQKGKELGITKENFNIWSNDPEKIKAISDALVNNRKAADDLQPAYKKVAAGIKDAFDAGDDSKKLEEALARIRDGMNEIMQVGSFLSGTLSSLSDAFGNDAFTGIADGINTAMDAMNSTMQGAQAGAMFGPIGASAGAAIGLVSSLATSIAKIHDKKNEKNIERLQDQIDVLDDSYNKLARSIEKAYSTDASDLIDQQNELLEQQKLLIQQQILEEKDKKKTDDGRIKEWEQQLKDIDEQIQDNAEKAQEAIAGISFDSFRNNFLDSLTDMDAKVEDLADNFEEYLKKAILNGLMADKYDSQIKELYEKWTAYGKDGLTEAEVEQLRKDYKDIANAMIADRDSLAQIYGWESESSKEQQSATAKGFETMSQDTAEELNGRFTAVYESNLRIEAAEQQQTVAITELRGSISALTAQASGMYNIADETRTILANSYLELQQIRENTGEIIKPIKQMQADMAEVKRNTSRL
jgi:tape measure domain-containing protein